MTNIFQLPPMHERLYKNVEEIIEARIRDLNHEPELAERVRKTAKEVYRDYAGHFDLKVSLTLSAPSQEDIKEIERAMRDVREAAFQKLDELFSVILRLEIEMCEYTYAAEKERRGLRVVK